MNEPKTLFEILKISKPSPQKTLELRVLFKKKQKNKGSHQTQVEAAQAGREQGKDRHGLVPLKISILVYYYEQENKKDDKTCLWDYTLLWACKQTNKKTLERDNKNKFKIMVVVSHASSILIPLGVIVHTRHSFNNKYKIKMRVQSPKTHPLYFPT